MVYCKNDKCKKEHDGTFGSGKFCCKSCSCVRERTPESILKYQETSKLRKCDPGRFKRDEKSRIEKVKATWVLKRNKTSIEDLSSDSRRLRVIDEQNDKCDDCGISNWFGKKIVLELHHIDGDSTNNKRKNLSAICPNCHSITFNWRGKNNTGHIKVSDECLLDALVNCINIRQALIKVGLVAKGGNYERAKSLLMRNKIEQ